MNTFEARLPKHETLFIPFITAGDPHEDATVEIALSLQKQGASILELGVPYSDPLADGQLFKRHLKELYLAACLFQKPLSLYR